MSYHNLHLKNIKNINRKVQNILYDMLLKGEEKEKNVSVCHVSLQKFIF